MDKELKEHLNRLEENMATKSNLVEIRKEMVTKADIANMATKSDIDKLNKDLVGYIEHIDTELQEHRRNSEVHEPAPLPNF